MTADLREYASKRDFTRTSEPDGAGAKPAAAEERAFVVQKHAATRLHWDFRLEWNGVLLSWAVTRGPSADPSAKRLAVRTEDHPLDYAGFEGTIPKGEYGGGTVMLWDNGTWAPLEDVDQGLAEGKLKFVLSGTRMNGAWMLVRMKPRAGEKRENWLLIKEHDTHATDAPEGLVTDHVTSVTTARTMEAIASGKPVAAKPAAKKRKPAATRMPEFRAVQLATLHTEAPDGDDWLHEIKYDGYRCLAALAGGKVRLYTRSGLDWTAQFGALVPSLEGLPCRSALIDGEVIAAGTAASFSELQARLKHGGALTFMAFDLLEIDGTDLRAEPLVRRKERLAALVGEGTEGLRYSTHVEGHGAEIWAKVCEAGQEGIIAKLGTSPYRAGRQESWRKLKCGKRQEFVIGGWSASDARDRPFASLLMGTYEGDRLVYRGRVGSGFGGREFDDLVPALKAVARKTCPFEPQPPASKDTHWVTPTLLAEVTFAELTSDGLIRHGVYQGRRSDKTARDVTLEQPGNPEEIMADSASRAATGDDVVEGIRITHPERKVYTHPPVTKLDVARHYDTFADRILPFLKDRPVSLLRCPQGTAEACFFQKHRGEGMPEAVGSVSVPGKRGPEDYISIRTAAGLVAAVQMGAIEFHIWGSRNNRLEMPDRLVFDLDPDEGLGFDIVRAAAVDLRDLLQGLGLPSTPMLSGGKGIHVIVPLKPKAEWPTVKLFAQTLATMLADREPDRFIATMSKAKRKGLIFIDWLRNERGATAIAPYALRARPGAGVAVPVTWEELPDIDAAAAFDVTRVLERMDRPCPLVAATKGAVQLGPRVMARLEKLLHQSA